MINFYESLVNPVESALNNALLATTPGGEFIYGVNDVPRNARYQFRFESDSAEYMHAEPEAGGMHENESVYINGVAQITPVSLDGAAESAYNALVNATVRFVVPVGRLRGQKQTQFLREIRRLVDGSLASSTSSFIIDGSTIYNVLTKYSLAQTGAREIRPSAGDSVEFALYLNFAIVASGISSDSIILTIDGERIYAQRVGFARKSVKEMGQISGEAVQRSFQSSTYLSINFDLPARFSNNPTTGGTSFNEKVAGYALGNTNTSMTVKVRYPLTISMTTSGGEQTTTVTDHEYTYTMAFDTVGINGETGLAASHSITLMEVPE